MNFTQSSKPLILVHKTMQRPHYDSLVNIMLSPQFYISKQEELAVKYLYQAKRLAPSILEELLDEGVEYKFYVFRRANGWVFIAYNLKSIEEFLLTKGITPSNVSKMSFAQQYGDDFLKPILLESGELLTTIQDTVVLLPKVLVDSGGYYGRFDREMQLRDGVTFSLNSGSLLGQKESFILSFIFVIFAIILAVEGLRYKSISTTMSQEIETLLSQYPSLGSQYARDNIAKKYQKIDKIERQKRDILKELSMLVISDVQIDSITLDSKNFVAIFSSKTPKNILRISSLAKKKNYKVSRMGSEKLIKVEGSL